MPDNSQALERIERAIARIEAAARAHAYATDRIARRHDALRRRVQEAVESLDALMLRPPEDEEAQG